MRLNHREADRFQDALEGGPITDKAIAELIERSRELVDVASYAAGPRPEFVTSLRERLVAEAVVLPHRPITRASRAAETNRSRPMVVVIGRGLPRLLAGVTASVLAVGGIVGAASQSALPGGALYPVRGFLDGVAVQLSGSDYDRGVTNLAQAREHVADARELAARGEDDPTLYVDALTSARTAVASAQQSLSDSFAETGSVQAPLQMTDFVVAVSPQLEASRAELPGAALGSLADLQAELSDIQVAWTSQLTACAPGCVGGEDAQELLDVLGLQELAELVPGDAPSTAKADPVVAPDGGTGVTVPGTAVTQPPSTATGAPGSSGGGGNPTTTSAPGVSIGSGGVAVGGDKGGATIGSGGVVVDPPAVTVPVVPSVTVPLPSVSVGTGGVGIGLPGATVGGITVPGVGVDLPAGTRSSPTTTKPRTLLPVLKLR